MSKKGGSQQRVARVAASEESRALLAEAKAWRAVAGQVFYALRHHRFNSDFLCWRAANYPQAEAMIARVHGYLHPEWDVAFAGDDESEDALDQPDYESRNQARVLACLWFALECEDESRSLRCQEG